MNKCKKCGTEIPEEFEYCRNCLENKTSFSFSIKEKPKEENLILQDNEEIEQEIEEEIKDYTPTEETEYEKYIFKNYTWSIYPSFRCSIFQLYRGDGRHQ